jgi:hypothetical protein
MSITSALLMEALQQVVYGQQGIIEIRGIINQKYQPGLADPASQRPVSRAF